MEALFLADAGGQHKIWDIFRVVNQSQEHPGTSWVPLLGKVPLFARRIKF